MAHRADEVGGYVNFKGRADSIHLESWPDDKYKKWHDKLLDEKWAGLINLREAVLKKLESSRQSGDIGSSLEARVVLTGLDEKYKKLLNSDEDILRYLFIVSEVE